jgi:hypothetical protein
MLKVAKSIINKVSHASNTGKKLDLALEKRSFEGNLMNY